MTIAAAPARSVTSGISGPTVVSRRRRGLPARFVRHRTGLVGLVVIVMLVAAAVLAEAIAPYDWRAQDILRRFSGPTAEHLLGTDELGRDIFSRLLYGARFSLSISVAAVGLSLAIGTALGVLAGFYRRLDGPLMRMVDIMMAFPGILLAIAIVAALGPGLGSVIIAIGINEIPGFARLNRSMVLSLRD